jgi:hypothetical protein
MGNRMPVVRSSDLKLGKVVGAGGGGVAYAGRYCGYACCVKVLHWSEACESQEVVELLHLPTTTTTGGSGNEEEEDDDDDDGDGDFGSVMQNSVQQTQWQQWLGLQRELVALASVRHPHIIRFYGCGTECHVFEYHIIPYHIISYHIISYHIILYHIILYHIISYHIISYH